MTSLRFLRNSLSRFPGKSLTAVYSGHIQEQNDTSVAAFSHPIVLWESEGAMPDLVRRIDWKCHLRREFGWRYEDRIQGSSSAGAVCRIAEFKVATDPID
jgi:hypothetical protein